MTNKKIDIKEISSVSIFSCLIREAAFRAIQKHGGTLVIEGKTTLHSRQEEYESGEPIERSKLQLIITLPTKEWHEAIDGTRRIEYFLHVKEGKMEARQDINVRLDIK